MREILERRLALVWLNAMVGISGPRLSKLASAADPLEIYKKPEYFSEKLKSVIGDAASGKIRLAARDADSLMNELEKAGAGVVCRGDPEYPELLDTIPTAPELLYYKGNVNLLKTRCLGVVGTRNPSQYGRKVTEDFVDALAKTGLTIVSGLARGVDGVAHRAALNADGKSIGVLGCGINTVYPSENASLYAEIAEKGLIISEYGVGEPPHGFYFPERNRIISGLSEGILVTEAGQKSGSLITADFALNQGRDIFIIPSAINSPRGAGGNEFLKSAQGALVTSPDDVAISLGIQKHLDKACAIQLDMNEELILSMLCDRPLHFDELMDLTGLGIGDLNALLTRMELSKLLVKLDNNFYGL